MNTIGAISNVGQAGRSTIAGDTTSHAPYVANPVPDQNYAVGFTTANIDITNVFADPDGTTPTWVVHSNSNPGVVTVAKAVNLLVVTEVGVGTTTIVLRATDGVYTVDDTFTITVA